MGLFRYMRRVRSLDLCEWEIFFNKGGFFFFSLEDLFIIDTDIGWAGALTFEKESVSKNFISRSWFTDMVQISGYSLYIKRNKMKWS